MQLSKNTVLVTGGASGIGLAIAKKFLDAGSRVIICGRSQHSLDAAQMKYPGLETLCADVGDCSDREALVKIAMQQFSDINVLVNNAGIQRRGDFLSDPLPWKDKAKEIAINLEAPIHLSVLLSPHFLKKDRAAIINVTSGLAFIPMCSAAVYSATKAALHSFTLALRSQLKESSISVIEIVPPAVKTDLGGEGVHSDGVPVNEFVDAVMARIVSGELEIGFGTSEQFRLAGRGEADIFFRLINNHDS